MSIDNKNEENTELQERIKSIKNISYLIYTWHLTIIVCTVIVACVMMLATAFLGQWYNTKLIFIGSLIGLAVIIISIVMLHMFSKMQFFIECENGKNILIVGGFRRFRKYYVNNSRYIIKKGQAYKITTKKIDSIKLLFSNMKRAVIVKTVSGNKEIFQIKQKKEDWLSIGLGGGLPAKYGTMTFTNGKFKKGHYTSTSNMSYSLHFKVIKDDIKCNDIVPQSILNLFQKNN